jgi:methionine-rich copper-binding protein CopC
MTRRSRLSLVLLVALAAALGATVPVLGATSPAQAHNYLVSSTPKAGETLTALPKDFAIITNDALLNIDGTGSGFGLQVTDRAGRYYGDGCVTVSGPEMSTAAALGAAGAYTVTWQAVSTDGHTVSDSYGFSWKPSADFTPSPGSAAVPNCNGTATVNESASPGSSSTASQIVDSGTLNTVLWIGGAILAVASAVILTLVFTGRKKRVP